MMDRSQSLNAPLFFYGSNYAFWKVRMRAFMCAMSQYETPSRMGLLNPQQPSPNGTRRLLHWQMQTVGLLMLYSVVCLLMNFMGYRMWRQPRKLKRFLRLPMRVPRKSRTQSSKCLPPDLKSLRWVMIWL